MLDLVGNPEDRFSRVEAHMVHEVAKVVTKTDCKQGLFSGEIVRDLSFFGRKSH